MKFPALILNPRSRLNNSGQQSTPPRGLTRAEPSTHLELHAALADYARQEVDLVIVSGGDGTVRDVITALPTAYGSAPLPAIAIVPSGNANLIARDVGQIRLDGDTLPRLLSAAHENHWQRDEIRQPIGVHGIAGRETPVYGLFMGAAALSRATQHFHQHIKPSGAVSVATTVLAALTRSVRGQDSWLSGESLSLAIDDQAMHEGARFIFLATSLHKLMLGLWPFWGEGQGSIRYLDVDAQPPRLARSLLPLLRGKPSRKMLEGGYRSGIAKELHLQLPRGQSLIIDGEAFAPGEDGLLHLRPGPALRFVVP